MLKMVLPGILLLYSSVTDLKSREISGIALLGFGIAGIVLMLRTGTLTELLLGCVTGLCLVVISLATGGKLGLGDALLVLVTGIYLGLERNTEILLAALFMSALFSVGVFAALRSMKKEYPFVPFLFLAYAVIIWG